MKTPSDGIFKARVNTFASVERRIGRRIAGRVLDIGCGNGYAAIWLALNREGVQVDAMEASTPAVSELIPKHVAHHGVADRVRPVLGSFEDIGAQDTYDFVVSFGAIHHASCLLSAMRSVAGALREGGCAIMNEPVMPNTTRNVDYVRKYDIVQDMLGLQIRNGDRDDHFFREAEYVVAAAFAGLDLEHWYVPDFDQSTGRSPLRRLLSRVRAMVRPRPAPRLSASEQAYRDATAAVSTRIMVFRKTSVPRVPHLWRALAPDAKASDARAGH